MEPVRSQTTAKKTGKGSTTTTSKTVRHGNATIVTTTTVMKAAGAMKQSRNSMTTYKTTSKKSMTAKSVGNSRTMARTGRSTMVKTDETSAPGQYDVKGMSFGENTKSFTIGVKRESKIEHSPGPGSYNADRSDSVTKSRNTSPV